MAPERTKLNWTSCLTAISKIQHATTNPRWHELFYVCDFCLMLRFCAVISVTAPSVPHFGIICVLTIVNWFDSYSILQLILFSLCLKTVSAVKCSHCFSVFTHIRGIKPNRTQTLKGSKPNQTQTLQSTEFFSVCIEVNCTSFIYVLPQQY